MPMRAWAHIRKNQLEKMRVWGAGMINGSCTSSGEMLRRDPELKAWGNASICSTYFRSRFSNMANCTDRDMPNIQEGVERNLHIIFQSKYMHICIYHFKYIAKQQYIKNSTLYSLFVYTYCLSIHRHIRIRHTIRKGKAVHQCFVEERFDDDTSRL